MRKVIVSDTSCLILFHKIGELELLHKTFGDIAITDTVSNEFNRPIPKWIVVINPTTNLHLALDKFIDPGEATSIALAVELKDSLLIIDDLKGRKVATELSIHITGSLGVLLTAKNNGVIDSVIPIVEKIQKTNFRMSNNLIDKILHLAQEG